MQPIVDIRPDHLRLVRDILRQHVPLAEVWAFGSRAKWLARDTSDLDLCIRDAASLSFEQMGLLREAFEESNLPYKVDVVDWATISASFRKVVERDKVVIQKGSVAGEWEESVLGELIEAGDAHLQTGPFGTALKAAEYSAEGVPLISVGEVRQGYFEVSDKTPRVSEETTKRLPKFILEIGDIVFGRKGGIDRNAFVHPQQRGWFLGSDGIRLRLSEKFSSLFFSYQMRSPATRTWLLQNCEGTTMPSLNQQILGRVPIVIPPLSEQKTIAHILGTLDDKIELNRRMNATLEAMARTLFQSWFVDFDPVRAKLDGRQPAGLDAATAALFPSHFQDSPLGPIPQGWEVGSILRQADLLSGGTPKTDVSAYWDGNILWASAKDVSQCGEAFLVSTERTITKLGVGKSSTKIIPALVTVIVARGATTGRLTMFGESMAMNQTCYGLKSKVDAPYSLYCHARYFIDRLVQGGHGSIFDTITTSTFDATDVLLAPDDVLQAFNRQVTPLFKQILANIHQSRTLAALRDALLPKLLSGEISITDTENLVEVVS